MYSSSMLLFLYPTQPPTYPLTHLSHTNQAFRVLPLMKAAGVRHNDMGNNFRSNRWVGGEGAIDDPSMYPMSNASISSSDSTPTTSDDEGEEDHIKGA